MTTSKENIATVLSFYEAFGRGDVQFILDHLTDDVRWNHDVKDHGLPWLKPGVGKAHVKSFFDALASEFDFEKAESEGAFVADKVGDDRIVVTFRFVATHKKTHKRVDELEVHLWTFATDGMVKGLRLFTDTLEAQNVRTP